MPLHDFGPCPTCGTARLDVYLPITQRAGEARIVCQVESCPESRQGGLLLEWRPQVGRMDCAGGQGSGSGFKDFQTYVKGPDGVDRLTHISSLHQLRTIERDTERHWANGEGQPMRWRAYANDASNQDRNTFGETPGDQVRRELQAAQADVRGRRDHLKVLRGAEAEVASRTLGPGVTEASASPLVVPFGPE